MKQTYELKFYHIDPLLEKIRLEKGLSFLILVKKRLEDLAAHHHHEFIRCDLADEILSLAEKGALK